MAEDLPDSTHRTPPGVDDQTVEALGALSEALETIERARGHLYSFHQLTGTADFQVEEAATKLRACGHHELADHLEVEVIGRNVLPGRWTFQVVEEFDDGYWATLRAVERRAREELVDGRRHLHEARLKQQRRTRGERGHEATPHDVDAQVASGRSR